MKTVNSLSGGKTSSYIAANYPADYDLFSLVCADSHNINAKERSMDKKLWQMANDKLQKYCSHYPEFQGTTEDPLILKTMFDLEQYTGREIIWLRGVSWEDMLHKKQAIPNQFKRFCSHILKIVPIFEFLYMRDLTPCRMRIGYRYDEKERQETFTDTFKFSTHCETSWNPKQDWPGAIGKNAPYVKKGRLSGLSYLHRWQEINWRIGEFPLIEDKISHYQVQEYWKNKGIVFPQDSNCQNCFWKDPQQLRKNYDVNPNIMKWAAVMESVIGNTFKSEMSFLQIRRIGLQQEFNFGTGSGCQAGGCTD